MRAPRAVRLLLWGAFAVLLAGCGDVAALTGRSGGAAGGGGRVSLAPLLDPDSVAIPGTNGGKVIDVLGEPTEIATVKAADSPDPEQGVSTQVPKPGRALVLSYEGLRVVVFELYQPSRNFISEIAVSSRDYRTDLGIRVGDDRGEIEEVLGEPLPAEDADASESPDAGQRDVYELTEQGDTVTVTYDGDRAAEIIYDYPRG